MEASQMLPEGFLSSSTHQPASRWAPPADLRRRLVGLGWPFTTAFATKFVSDSFDLGAFIIKHKRIPNVRKTGYLNDYLFSIKRSRADLELRRTTTDKHLAKQFLKERLGAEYTVPTLDVITDRDVLRTYQFPLNCIVKPTHLSGAIFRCEARQPSAAERAVMQSWFDIDYGLLTGEWHYRGLKPKIIIEPFISLNEGVSNDVRFFVYAGRVRVIELYCGRYHHATIDFLDRDWNRIRDLRAAAYPWSDGDPIRPQELSRMIDLAERIGAEFSCLRVDFFTDFAERFYIGELTHFTGNCRVVYDPPAGERYYLAG